jgi:2-furoyl-CoA dehydrogenase large subunit
VYAAEIALEDKQEPASVRLVGKASGALGFGTGEGIVRLAAADGGARLSYSYRAEVGGKVAAVGQRLLGTVTRVLIAEFFAALERRVAPRAGPALPRWLAMLRALFRRDAR